MLPPITEPRRFQSRYPIVRAVSQIQLRIESSEADVFKMVQQGILEWMRRKAGKTLPKAGWDGLSFELDEVGAQRAAAVSLDQPRYWAARVDDACKDVAQRTWITEIGLAAADAAVLFGCRLIVSARGENPLYQPSIPVFVRDAIKGRKAYLDGRTITDSPWFVNSREEVTSLYHLLIDKTRRSDVCVFSLPENSEDVHETAASANRVHLKTLGAAHVVILSGPAASYLTDLVDKEYSVFNRAVRTYRPGFDTDSDDPIRHPLAMAHRIASWQAYDLQGPLAFETFLCRTTILQTVAGSDLEQRLPPFSEVRRAAATASVADAREAGASTEELLKLYEDDNAKLRATIEENRSLHDGLLADADRDRDLAQRRSDEAKSEIYRLNQRIRYLESQTKTDVRPEHNLPEDLEALKTWSEQNLAGSVQIANRALRGAKESSYEEPRLVYEALLLLRDHYVPMRREGGDVLTRAYETRLGELGLEEERSITGTRLAEQGDEYLIQHAGAKRELDRHFKKGSSRDPRYCFRLYFFWDDENEQAVVGWLTSHLDTRKT